MTNFESLRPFYPFDPPAALQALSAEGLDASRPFLSEEELSAVASDVEFYLDDRGVWYSPCEDFLHGMVDALLADPARNLAALHLRRYLIEVSPPWEVHLHAERLLDLPGYSTAAIDLLFVTAALGYTLTVRKPPYSINSENIGSYIGYTRSYLQANGEWGISERAWNMLGSGGCMFLFHTLKFQPERFSPDFLVLRDQGGNYCTLLKGSHGVAADGSLTKDEAKVTFRTEPLREVADAYYAHEVLPDGTVSPDVCGLPKAVWSVALDENSLMLGFHIPSQRPYTVEDHRESMKQAYEFYGPFLKNVGEIKGFVCYSWLYSAQNKHILPPSSRILEMQRHVHLCPMTAELDENLMFLRKGSSLQQRLADFRAAGNAYHVGYMYVPLEEAMQFGEFTHEL